MTGRNDTGKPQRGSPLSAEQQKLVSHQTEIRRAQAAMRSTEASCSRFGGKGK